MTPAHDEAVRLLEAMVLLRRFEERCAEEYTTGKIRGFLHLYFGQEAVAVGVMQALGREDAVIGTYREHGHALLRGIAAGAIMAEMYRWISTARPSDGPAATPP